MNNLLIMNITQMPDQYVTTCYIDLFVVKYLSRIFVKMTLNDIQG